MRLPFTSAPSRHFGRRWLVLPGQAGFWNDHIGTDWAKNKGTPVAAAASGTVIANFFTSLKGYQLHIRDDAGRVHKYNMLNFKPTLGIGTRVKEGQTIGQVGSSGTASTGPHLHYELWVNGKPVDAYKYITALLAAEAVKPFPVPAPAPPKPPTTTPSIPSLEEDEEEDDMAKTSAIFYERKADKVHVFALVNPVSGFYTEWSGVNGDYNAAIAKGFSTDDFVKVTEGHAGNIRKSAEAVRKGL